jgi:hypothetical protein
MGVLEQFAMSVLAAGGQVFVATGEAEVSRNDDFGGAEPQSGDGKKSGANSSSTPSDFITVVGEMFVNQKGVAALGYNTAEQKGKLAVSVDGVGAITYDIGEDLSKSNPGLITASATPIIDESRWQEKGIYRVHQIFVKEAMKYAITPFLGESLTSYAMNKFNEGHGQAWYMGSSYKYMNGARYDIQKFRVYFDLVVQRVNTSIWVDFSYHYKK